ncbi:MAG: patatin-like phospholipase family protein [Candidatus Eremiobacteraeota bacterium]|nr:patatin-like phospholipase family protein [Candidatus Eremiobacteraeota bacterium]
MARKPKLPRVKTALILEGGGAKGAFEAGVIKYIYEKKIPIDLVCGTSVGAINAAFFAFRKIKDLIKLWSWIQPDQVYHPWPSHSLKDLLSFTHIFSNSPLEKTLRKHFKKTKINKSPVPIVITAFNLQKATIETFDHNSKTDLVDVLMASSAIQGIFPPRVIANQQYIDGGNGDNLPLKYAIDNGCKRLIVARCNLPKDNESGMYNSFFEIVERSFTAHYDYMSREDIKRANKISKYVQRQNSRDEEIIKLFEDKIKNPALVSNLKAKIALLPKVIPDKYEIEILVIEPDFMPVEILEFENNTLKKLLEHGYEKAEESIEEKIKKLSEGK